eukprot:tig00001366_g8392.t1
MASPSALLRPSLRSAFLRPVPRLDLLRPAVRPGRPPFFASPAPAALVPSAPRPPGALGTGPATSAWRALSGGTGRGAGKLRWGDYAAVAEALDEAHPDADLLRIRFPELRAWVLALPNFGDNPALCNEGHLEQIHVAWMEERGVDLDYEPLEPPAPKKP